MRKLLIPMAILTATVAAMPAAAQNWGNRGYGHEQRYDDRYERGDIRQLGWRIEQLARSGQLSRNEASQLRREYQYLAQLERRYGHNGLNRAERRELDRRTDALERRVRYERNDNRWDRDRRDRRW